MNYEIWEAFQYFLEDFKNGIVQNLYLREDEMEDEFSYEQIRTAQIELQKKIRKYLKRKAPGKYRVSVDWCVRVENLHTLKECKTRQ